MTPPRFTEPNHELPRLRLVSYNIHKGIGGVDRRYRPERVVTVLRRCAADLILLQEVDEGVPRSRHDRQVDLLGDELDLPFRAFVPNVFLRRGHYGNAILSRYPFDFVENINLTRPLKKRRAALHVRFTLPCAEPHRLWLFNVHLGLAEYERRQQLRIVLNYLRHHRVRHDTSVILAGDFNDVWQRLGPAILRPAGFESVTRAARTFPAVRPLRPLDRVFVRGPLDLQRCYAGRMRYSNEASDHRPLIASLRLQ